MLKRITEAVKQKYHPIGTFWVLKRLEQARLECKWEGNNWEETKQKVAGDILAEVGIPHEHEDGMKRVLQRLVAFADKAKDCLLETLYGPELSKEVAEAAFGRNIRSMITNPEVLPQNVLVLIIGETGAGKERIAELIAFGLAQEEKRYAAVNAATLSEELFLSTLFGHVRGAFTGAVKDRIGFVPELDRGGVLFLDEITETALGAQARLLRFLDNGGYRRLGEEKERTANIHVIAATNRTENELRDGTGMRRDLYFRLTKLRPPVLVPPLRALLQNKREASKKTEWVFWALRDKMVKDYTQTERQAFTEWVAGWAADAARQIAELMDGYQWPGNMREMTVLLREILEVGPEHVHRACERLRSKSSAQVPGSSEDVFPVKLEDELAKTRREWYEAAARGARNIIEVSERLGVSRQTASQQLKMFGIQLPKTKS